MTRLCCTRCLRPQSHCICALAVPVDNELELLILQHPLEARQAKGTARLLHLCLAHSRLLVGEVFDPAELAPLLASAVLLYPNDPARHGPPLPAAPSRLIVLDGTWRKSRKMLALNPLLQALPRLSWEQPPASRYAVRKAQRAHQLSTLEAAALALEQLEARDQLPLWLAFQRLMDGLGPPQG
ncbi:DTW domain-containing protein [Paucibacter sp. PLA-PC-4]|uniref:tRNA-uridine aminocarboxypropyltransferase n=1 Tax=Paucibacter sp. PLA-PC-4 TaxID=2993655 RepID=UPI002248BB97|nr:tRNA-uridine aminocarboxypropyltransferase [Paucibacter sp. PLA-PC-4]MCX2862190.1 DTW domain-containing protein [Paucibacter sp. PLA-PC-4]